MPILKQNEIMKVPGSTFQFSAIKPEHLEATEYTLVSVIVDVTGSVEPFSNDLLKMLQEVIRACQKNPRSENLLVRLVTFNTGISEEHGFKLLADIDPAAYPEFNCGGMTALFDATFESIGATLAYSQKLTANDFTVNGAVYIITDGADNSSRFSPKMIKSVIEKAKTSEVIESLITVLVGINTADCKSELEHFKNEAALTQYVDMGDVTPGKLAKLAGFISKSVSSQSQSLGSGGPSQPIALTI
jgi:uncharacterized protein YegL